MKRVKAKIDKMQDAVVEYLAAKKNRDERVAMIEPRTKEFVKPNGQVIQVDDSIGIEECIESIDRLKKATKSAKLAIVAAAESLGYRVKTRLLFKDEIVSASELISFQYMKVMEALNSVSKYNRVLSKTEFITDNTEVL